MASKISTTDALTLNELVPMLKRCMKTKRPAFLWAGPGIGKSSLVNALAKEMDGICIDARLSQMDPTDVRGIPMLDKNTNTMKWATPDFLPSEEFASKYPVVILFLDEMNSAPPAVQAAAYQLVLDRRVGAYKLPDNVVMVAAGNRETDRGVTYRMSTALANRFVHFDVKHDYDSWLDWAIQASINKDIIAYLSSFKSELCNFDPSSQDKAFPTPRTWEFASQLISTDKNEPKLSDGDVRTLLGSSVGVGTATKFMAYLRVGKDLPKPGDILSGKIKEIKVREISAHYQIIISMLYEMKEFWYSNSTSAGTVQQSNGKNVEKRKWNADENEKQTMKTWIMMLENFTAFLMSQVETEVAIMGLRLMLLNYAMNLSTDIAKLKTFPELASKYYKYVVDVGK